MEPGSTIEVMPDSADDDPPDELLKKSPFEEPSPFGELRLYLEAAPASLQSRQTAIDALRAVIHEQTSKYQFLLTGDVSMEITWHFHERHRYESDASADFDNLLKPMLDAFCGTNGLLVEDCQVRSLGISWISTTSEQPAVTIEFRFIDSDFVPKAGIAFVQIEKALCMPVNLTLPRRVQRILFIIMRYQFVQRRFGEKIRRLDYYNARTFLPVQRRFHRTRLRDFTVMNPKECRAQLRLLP
jgi:Holliday junction resolvase RusA-like endonuclease